MPEPPQRSQVPGRSDTISSAPGIEFHLDASGLVRTTLSGTITADDLIAHLLARSAAGHLHLPQIFLAQEARLAIGAEDVKRIAVIVGEFRKRGAVGPSALVAFDDVTYGISRMFSAYIAEGGFAVFRSVAEAEAWLLR